jgi:hypothetical protein
MNAMINSADGNEKWECYLCCNEENFETLPHGYLGNYHPLCCVCAYSVIMNKKHKDYFRLTYYIEIGDIKSSLADSINLG